MAQDDKFLSKFQLYFLLSRFWLHLPIWVIFYASKGFTLAEVALISNVMWVTVILFEIPTGFVADKLGRKISLVTSYIFQATGMLLFVLSTKVLWLVMAQFVWGIGLTLSSGAETAWIYDETIIQYTIYQDYTIEQAKDKYELNYGRFSTIGHLSLGLAQILGGIIAGYKLYLPHTISALLFLGVALLLLSIPETKNSGLPEVVVSEIIKEESKDDLKMKAILGLLVIPPVLALGVIDVVISSFDDIKYFMQEHIVNSHISIQFLGFFFAAIMFAVSFGSNISKSFVSVFPRVKYQIIIGIYGLGFIFMAYLPIIGVMLVYLIMSIAVGVLIPILNTDLNYQLVSGSRATVLSIINIFNKFVYIIFSIAIAGVIDIRGFSLAYLITGIAFLALCLPSLLYILVHPLRTSKDMELEQIKAIIIEDEPNE